MEICNFLSQFCRKSTVFLENVEKLQLPYLLNPQRRIGSAMGRYWEGRERQKVGEIEKKEEMGGK